MSPFVCSYPTIDERPRRTSIPAGAVRWEGIALSGHIALAMFGRVARRFLVHLPGLAISCPVPLLSHHDASLPLGQVDEARVDGRRLRVAGWLDPLRAAGLVAINGTFNLSACLDGHIHRVGSDQWAEVNGEPVTGRDGDPVYTWQKASLREVSIVFEGGDQYATGRIVR